MRDKLAPVSALKVRACEYGATRRLNRGAVLLSAAASTFGEETNQLAAAVNPICIGGRAPFFFVSFASSSQRVDLLYQGGCDVLTNGRLSVFPTSKWLVELLLPKGSTRISAFPAEVGETSDCADVFRVGRRAPSYPNSLGPCIDPDRRASLVATASARCKDGTTQYWNEYGWWTTNDSVVKPPTLEDRPPPAALERCSV